MTQQQNRNPSPDQDKKVRQDDADGAIPGSDQDTQQQQQSDPKGNRQQGGQPSHDIEGERD